MNTKIIIIVACILIVGCTTKNKQQEIKVVYDEAALKDFVLASVDSNKSKSLALLDSIFMNALPDSTIFHQTAVYLEKHFSDPNSPYRNENLYSKVLHTELQSKWYSNLEKSGVESKLTLMRQNEPGNAANNFNYTTPAGYKKKMYDINSTYTLLFFYNPGCDACKNMKSALISSPVISNKIARGNLKLLAVYTDTDEKIWLDHLGEFPGNWIQGRDEDEYLYKNKIYDLRAIPTIYLLDKNKKVILKDCMSITEIEKNLQN